MQSKKRINIEEVWTNYLSLKKEADRHKLIMNYIGLVKYVLYQMNLPLNSLLEEGDFLNYGVLGLCEAIERYESDRGVKFESFAVPRIRGRIQDELRKLDWLSRTARKKASELVEVTDKIRGELGRDVSHDEIIDRLNITPQQFQSYLEAAHAAKASISLNEYTSQAVLIDNEEYDILQDIPDDSHEDKLSEMERTERIGFIVEYLNQIKEKKRLVISLYYYENLTFKEIGNMLEISESRVCQIHTQVLREMKDKLVEYDYA